MSTDLYSVKAGRAVRRANTNFVDPQDAKGLISLSRSADGLLHFFWKNRATGANEIDLITFPGDASIARVSGIQGGRVFVLKFSSSDHRYFFWLQDADTSLDEQHLANLNGFLENPDFTPEYNIADAPPASAEGSSGASQATVPSTSALAAAASTGNRSAPTPAQLAQIRSLVENLAAPPAQASSISLSDILTPSILQPVFSSPELLRTLLPHLPPDLPADPSPDVIRRIIESPQFQAAIRQLQYALETGLLGDLVAQMGLPREAGTSVEAFLRAIGEHARGEGGSTGGDNMETD
ncbi:hypothetical protein BOTBODRAFT_26890 [Botryobasidium botryosum FD-172 SS1]|uniref:Uncharacterized protein n=1 Tax=Botryobasidium botryosum (strain FD-172 SS1) TaxID=930990 RepID=A0A067N1R5_BOTB1|nr:hypothetical protein BOTBODRAFT_26890 [Botryobasidium botryosum FD-172 SS1]